MEIRDGHAAVVMALKAGALTGGTQPEILDALAMSYAELGDFNEAQQTMQNAITEAKLADLTNDLAAFQKRLQLYQNQQPFRQSFTNSPTPVP